MIIKTSKGQEIEIDDEDYEKVCMFTWCVVRSTKNLFYAVSRYRLLHNNSRQKNISIHRLIMGASPGQFVDHIDGNGLNNKKSNLRFVDNSKNQMNSRKRKASSQYKGVCWNKKDKRWQVHVWGKYFGCYREELDAAKRYNEIAEQLFGEYAKLNNI